MTGGAEGDRMPAELIHDLGALAVSQAEPSHGRARTVLSVSLSLLLHSSAAAAVLLAIEQTDIGAISLPNEAISVEIVSSSVLEAMHQKDAKEEAAQAKATASKVEAEAAEASKSASKVSPPETKPDKDATDDSAKVASAETEMKEAASVQSEETERQISKPLTDEPAPIVAPPPPVTESQSSEDDGGKEEAHARQMAGQAQKEARERQAKIEREARDRLQREAEAERYQEERKREARRKEEEHKERKQKRAEQGGVTAKSSAAANGSSGRVSASAGSVLTYAARVRAKVAGHKPSGAGARGTAVVAFGVTSSGGLGHASVSRSSGNSSLDRLAVSAVRGAAPFPQPPAGASASQLRFTIPFHFQ